MSEYHYYACTVFNWAVAATRREAIAKVAKAAGAAELAQRRKGKHGGLYVWSCRVEVAQTTPYRIEYYRPQGVNTTRGSEGYLINVRGALYVTD